MKILYFSWLKEKIGLDSEEIKISEKIEKYINNEMMKCIAGIEMEAYEKGIREGDLIKRVGTEKVTSVKDFKKLIEKLESIF